MYPIEQTAYTMFLQTGKIQDYLNYVDVRVQESSAQQSLTGEQGAYFDRWNCSARETD